MQSINATKQLLELKDRPYHLPELVVLREDTASDLLECIEQWLKDLETASEQCGLIKQIAYDSHQRRNVQKSAGLRVALTAYTEGELRKKLVQMRKMIIDRPQEGFSYPAAGLFYGVGESDARMAFLFPGQGSQYLGMGKALADAFPAAHRVWDTLGRMRFGNKSIMEMVFPTGLNEEEQKWAFLELCGADWASPSIAVAGEAILSVLEELGAQPDVVGSHSFGDVAALRGAHVLSSEDMLKAIRYRGDLGDTCSQATRGCILIVPENATRIKAELSRHGIEKVWAANYNCESQTVLSGLKEGISKAHEVFQAQGISSRLIPISAAPHCPLSYDVSNKFYDYLKEIPFNSAYSDVYSNLFGRKVGNDPDIFRKILKAQTEKPVRFLHQIQQMHQDGVRIFVEVGPSDVLTQLVDQILEGKEHIALSTDQRKKDSVLVFMNTVAELYKAGRVKDLAPLWEGYGLPGPAGLKERSRGITAVELEKYLNKLDLEFAKIDKIERGYITAQAV